MTQNNNISVITALKQAYMVVLQNASAFTKVFSVFIALLIILMSYYTYTILNYAAGDDALLSGRLGYIPVIILFLITVVYGCKACCDWVSYLVNKDVFFNKYNPFKLNPNNWKFLIIALALQLSIVILSTALIILAFVALYIFGTAFGGIAGLGEMLMNVSSSTTPSEYVIMALLGGFIALIHFIIICFALNRLLKFPAFALGAKLTTNESKAMIDGYKLKLFFCMLLTWFLPAFIVLAGHSYFFNAIDGITKAEWFLALIFATKQTSYAFIYVLISWAMPMTVLTYFYGQLSIKNPVDQ